MASIDLIRAYCKLGAVSIAFATLQCQERNEDRISSLLACSDERRGYYPFNVVINLDDARNVLLDATPLGMGAEGRLGKT